MSVKAIVNLCPAIRKLPLLKTFALAMFVFTLQGQGVSQIIINEIMQNPLSRCGRLGRVVRSVQPHRIRYRHQWLDDSGQRFRQSRRRQWRTPIGTRGRFLGARAQQRLGHQRRRQCGL